MKTRAQYAAAQCNGIPNRVNGLVWVSLDRCAVLSASPAFNRPQKETGNEIPSVTVSGGSVRTGRRRGGGGRRFLCGREQRRRGRAGNPAESASHGSGGHR